MKTSTARVVQIKDRRRTPSPDLPAYKRYMTPEELEEYVREELEKPEKPQSKLKQWIAALIMLSAAFALTSLSGYLHGGRQWIETEQQSTKQILKSTTELKSFHLASGTES